MIQYASTFLSYSSKQRDFVEDVERELVRRGILTWRDVHELPVGVDLEDELREGVNAQLTMTAFISEESIASDWCKMELAPRLGRVYSKDPTGDAILPVYLGDPLKLLSSSDELADHWLSADKKNVTKKGIKVPNLLAADPAEIARELARANFLRLDIAHARQVVIVLDQRGPARPGGKPELAPSWSSEPWPALVFRPNMGERSESETLNPVVWRAVRDAMVQALGDAMGPRRRRDVYVTGNAQFSMAWQVGQHLDRSSGIRLICRNTRRGEVLEIDFNDSRFVLPLPNLPPSDVAWHSAAPDATTETVSMYLGDPKYADEVHKHRAAAGDSSPLAVRATGYIEKAEQVIDLARWIATASGMRPVTLYTGLPFHALPLLAALLKHETGRVTLMEWDKGARVYRPCSMIA